MSDHHYMTHSVADVGWLLVGWSCRHIVLMDLLLSTLSQTGLKTQ